MDSYELFKCPGSMILVLELAQHYGKVKGTTNLVHLSVDYTNLSLGAFSK